MAEKALTAYCRRSGEIGFARRLPNNAIILGRGPDEHVRKAAGVVARHAYDGKTLLVPGIPEALTDDAALEAVAWFRRQMVTRLNRYAQEDAHG